MYDWIIESLMVGCQKLHRMRSRSRSLRMQKHWRQGWRAVEAGRETVEADYVIYNRSNTCSDNNSNADYKLMEY